MNHLLRAFVVISVATAPGAALAQCTKDTDCKGDRVCENGMCVPPGERAAPPPPPQYSPPPPPPEARPVYRPAPPPRLLELPKNVLSIDPLATVGGYLYGANNGFTVVQVAFLYERVLLPQLSVFGTLVPAITSGIPAATAGLTAGLRWYFLGGAPGGVWVGGDLGILRLNFGLGMSLQAGYQWVLDNGLALGITGGLVIGGDGLGGLLISPGLGGNVGWNF